MIGRDVNMRWLPNSFPANVRVVVSITGEKHDVISTVIATSISSTAETKTNDNDSTSFFVTQGKNKILIKPYSFSFL